LFLNMLFELKLNDYIIFLLSFLTLLNFIYLLFYILFYFIKSIGLKKLIDWKKLFVFFNIVFSTLLSPPDIYSQLTVLFLLLFLFEFLLFMYIVILKNKKYIKKVKY
jgi:Sec-independent protein secretion pathway component TatC